jgi:D-3-phosphoglycerate dehydrogenase
VSGPRVALIETFPPDDRRVLEESLPRGWEVVEGDGALAEAEYAVVRDGTLDAGALGRAPRLRRVVRIAMGGGGVDEAACAELGVEVEVVQSPSLISVAEHAVMAALALLKRLPRAAAELRAGTIAGDVAPAVTTQESYAFNWVGIEHWEALYGKTVGLVGLGQIGTRAARLFAAFGADVLYFKPNRLEPPREEALGVRYAAFDDLLASAHCVSLHNRFTPETERMMGAREFALMRPGSVFVNTARGRLVDEDALLEAVESGHLAGAALDVFWVEPLPAESPLLRAPNLLLTPHTGGIPIAESRSIELRTAARLLAGAG